MTNRERELVEEKIGELLQEIAASFKDSSTIPDYVKFLENNNPNIKCSAIGYNDGIMNFIYRIEDGKGLQSVVVKWARKVLRLQEVHDIGMTEDKYDLEELRGRNVTECMALKLIEKYVPNSTPTIYYQDKKRFFFMMQDLRDYTTLKDQLDNGIVIPEVFDKVAMFMAKLHRSTHIKVLPEEVFEEIKQDTAKAALLDKDNEKWFFDEGFLDPNRSRKTKSLEKVLPQIINNDEIRAVLMKMQTIYQTRLVCLLHNDSHPGFVMVNKENDVKVIDAELCRVGFPAKEVGYFLGEVIVWYYVNWGRGKFDVCKQIVECTRSFVKHYMEEMKDLLADDFIPNLCSWAGIFNGARTVNLMPFPQFEGLEEAEAECVQVAANLLRNMSNITIIEDFIQTSFKTN